MQIKNDAGFEFYWPEGSDIIEVYRSDVSYSDIPVWAERVNFGRSKNELQKFSNREDFKSWI